MTNAAGKEFDRGQVRRYLTSMKTKVSTKGQIVLPAELRRQDRIRAGQQFEVERIQSGQYLLKKIKKSRKAGIDLVDWLLACPVKDWFQPIPSSETTDQIKNPFEP